MSLRGYISMTQHRGPSPFDGDAVLRRSVESAAHFLARVPNKQRRKLRTSMLREYTFKCRSDLLEWFGSLKFDAEFDVLVPTVMCGGARARKCPLSEAWCVDHLERSSVIIISVAHPVTRDDSDDAYDCLANVVRLQTARHARAWNNVI